MLRRAVLASRGVVTSVSEGMVAMAGIPDVRQGELLSVGSSALPAVVVSVDKFPQAVVLGDSSRIGTGEVVTPQEAWPTTLVGPGLAGRVIDPLAAPLDGLPPPVPADAGVSAVPFMHAARLALPLSDRAAVTQPLRSGVAAIDVLRPIGHGQRIALVGQRGVGKSTVAQALLRAAAADAEAAVGDLPLTRFFYVSIGRSEAELAGLVSSLDSVAGLRDRTTVIAAGEDSGEGMAFIAPFAGMAAAAEARSRGQRAVLVLDELSACAAAHRLFQRQLQGSTAIAASASGDRIVSPVDCSPLFSGLLEAAGAARSGGSVSVIAICDAAKDCGEGIVGEDAIALSHGVDMVIPFSSTLAKRGVLPPLAVDATQPATTSLYANAALSVLGRVVRSRLSATHDAMQSAKWAQDLNMALEPDAELAVDFRDKLQRLLEQDCRLTAASSEGSGAEVTGSVTGGQLMLRLLPLVTGVLDGVELHELPAWQQGCLDYVMQASPRLLSVVEETPVDGDMEVEVMAELTARLREWDDLWRKQGRQL